MITPTPTTDAAPPERGCEGIVFLAGAIKYWWLKRCSRSICGALLSEDAEVCWACNSSAVFELWGSPEHQEYVAYRNHVRALLIEADYLTYAPHEAFKGTWDERAQAVNDAGIAAADLMLNLSPEGVPTVGTDDEVAYAVRIGTPVMHVPPASQSDAALLLHVEQLIRRP